MLKRIRALLNKTRQPDQRPSPAAKAEKVERPPVHRGPTITHRPIPTQDVDADAVKIIRRLTRFDHTAYLVGGCVRDLLLERRPKDFDITTSATPRQIKRLFRNCRIIGRRFRLAHIYFQNNKVIEVATFRARDGEDSEEAGGGEDLLIRDDNVFGTAEEDALRRDFTINSLFYDVNDETVLDHAGGLDDLRRKLVRAIGDPGIRFREDPIRILRAIKFAARLGFQIESATLKALQRTRGEIRKAASPRVLEEIYRCCRGGAAARSFELFRETWVFGVILPELAERYRRRRAAWDLTLSLLAELDRRRTEKNEQAGGGAIFGILLLPLITEQLGWHKDGTADQPRGLNTRQFTDELLRPLALHLRVPRRDQESCRQIIMTLFRMVPSRRVRRSTRQSILRRECLSDALWILKTLAGQYGGDFGEASEYWHRAAQESRPRAKQPGPGAERPAARAEGAGSRKRRRRRSKGARPRPGKVAAQREDEGRRPAKPEAQPQPKRDDLPPPWDDRYFFAALPSVPKLQQEKSDRYGATELKGGEAAAEDPDRKNGPAGPRGADDDTKSQGKRKTKGRRRRRSRSRRRSGQQEGDSK